MGATVDDRWRGGVLTGLAVAALVAGAWWWRQAAPATGPVPAAVGSTPPTPAPTELLDRVIIDAKDGRVIEGPEADPDQPLVLHLEPGATGVPERPEIVWADRSHLSPGGPPVIRQTGAETGGRYLLVASCVGGGPVTILVGGADGEPAARVDCAGPPALLRLTAVGGPLEVRFAANGGPLDLDAHLSTLS